MPRIDLIAIRGGTAAEWTSADPVLAPREIGFETDTKRIKFGDGSTAWTSLAYATYSAAGVDSLLAGKADSPVDLASDVTNELPVANGGAPAGGTTNQVLKKQSNADYDYDWDTDNTGSGGYSEGTSFPGSPSTDDKFYRTDRNILYVYDDTRWLSANLYISYFQAVNNITADASFYWPIPYLGTYSLYLERLDVVQFRTASGEWDAQLFWVDASNTETSLAIIDGSGVTTNTWTGGSATLGSVLNSNAKVLKVLWDEISGTSGVYGHSTIAYRLIG